MDPEPPRPEPAPSRLWQAPQLTVLGTLRSVTQAGVQTAGDASPNGSLGGDSGSI